MNAAVRVLVLLAGLRLRSLDLIRAHWHLPLAEEDREVVPVSCKLTQSPVAKCRDLSLCPVPSLPQFSGYCSRISIMSSARKNIIVNGLVRFRSGSAPWMWQALTIAKCKR